MNDEIDYGHMFTSKLVKLEKRIEELEKLTQRLKNDAFDKDEQIAELKKRVELNETINESLTINLDILDVIKEGLDNIGVQIYKIYNKIKEILEE